MRRDLNGRQRENKRYLYWGFFFLLLQILVIVRNLSTDYFSFFWYCDFAPAIFSILFFWRNEQAIKGLINIGFFMQLAYTLIIVTKLIFGITLFGFIINFPLTSEYVIPTLIIHLGTIFAFVAVYRVKPRTTSLVYSFVFLVFIYALVIVFTNPTVVPGGNFNFIYFPQLFSDFSFYTEVWVGVALIMIVVPTHLFQLLVWSIFAHHKRKASLDLYHESISTLPDTTKPQIMGR